MTDSGLYIAVERSPVMTDSDGSVRDDASGAPLELLTDDEDVWTAVPVDASGDERIRKWLSVEADALCDLEEWR